jgi:hypothetical protein
MSFKMISGSEDIGAKETQLIVRCECGTVLRESCEAALVESVRLHIGEFHPDLGTNIPADLILAMAEEKENKQK